MCGGGKHEKGEDRGDGLDSLGELSHSLYFPERNLERKSFGAASTFSLKR